MHNHHAIDQFIIEMKALQQVSINPNQATDLYQLQQDSLKEAIEDGLELLHQFEQHQLTEQHAGYAFLTEHHLFHQHVQNDIQHIINHPEYFISQQTALYRLLDDKNISTPMALFFELMIGYTRVDVVIQTAASFIEFLNKKYALQWKLPTTEQTPIFFKRMQAISQAATYLHDQLADLYLDNLKPHKYWEDIKVFLSQHPKLDKLARHLFSMQYRPKDLTRVSLAQILHFNGNGGDFECLKQFAEFKPLASNAINVQGTLQSAQSKFDNIALFKPTYQHFVDYITHNLSELLQQHFEPGDTIDVYDVGSGSTCRGVMTTIEANPEFEFNLVASDVDFHNIELISQAEFPNNCHCKDVQLNDLNRPLVARPEDIDRFDLSSASIVLHQLFPEEKNKLIRYLTQITKPGGIISNPDAGIDNTYLQLYILPFNTADREGGTVWTPVEATAVPTDDPDIVKVAVPLLDLAYPELDSPYVCHFYRVELIRKEMVAALAEAVRGNDMQRCYYLVQLS